MANKLILGGALLLALCISGCRQNSLAPDGPAICQSCGMPMIEDTDHGTGEDGMPSDEYCLYCYTNGRFIDDCTMEQMIDHCAQFYKQRKHKDGTSYTREEAVNEMRELFPTLKRWKK